MKYYTYVFVRRDIPVRDQVVQVGHVCIEAGHSFKIPDGLHMVVIGVEDSIRLCKVEELLNKHCIEYKIFFEPDDNMGHTAICTEPLDHRHKKVFKKFLLWE